MELIIQIGLVILLSSFFAVFLRFLKQPPLVAYLFVGIALSAFGLQYADPGIVQFTGEVGILLLLYLTGLEMSFTKLRATGMKTLIVSVSQVVIFFIYFLLAKYLFGWSDLTAAYIAMGFTLSSTIVAVKALSERGDISSVHGQVLIGLMLIQDIIGMIAIAFFTSFGAGGGILTSLGFTLLKGAGVFLVLYFIGKIVLPKVFEKASESVDLVFIMGVGWMFFGVLLASALGFSIELGAFIAGLSIASLSFSFEIQDRSLGLRDFGLLLFFSAIGIETIFSREILLSLSVWLFVGLVLIMGPLIIMVFGGMTGLNSKRAFFVSMLSGQVSEFSMVLAAIGFGLGHISAEILSVITIVAIITIVVSSGITSNLDPIYKFLQPVLKYFEFRKDTKKETLEELKDHVVVFGYGKLGQKISDHFGNKNIIVVDWQLSNIEIAKKKGVTAIYGDMNLFGTWMEARLGTARLMINTVEDKDFDLNVLYWLKVHNKKIKKITETSDVDTKEFLVKEGFHHVLLDDDAEWDVLKKFLTKFKRQA